MTALDDRPVTPAAPSGPSRRAATGRRGGDASETAVVSGRRRTLLALAASALAAVPLKGLFTDWVWLLDVWLTMLVVVVPALLLRRRRPPNALDVWPGIVLLVPWLTLLFLRGHALAGVIPTAGTFHDLSALFAQLHHTTHDEAAPIRTNAAVRLVVCALLGLVAALIDLIAVVGRHGALAGVPMLVVYTIAGAVPRNPVPWPYFLVGAAGFFLVLGIDAGDSLDGWGRRVRAAGTGSRGANVSRTAGRLTVAAPRIAITALLAALVLPLAVPSASRNLLTDAFHHGGSGSGVAGLGGGSNGALAPFAALQGQLTRTTPLDLATVHVIGSRDPAPFYLRVNVLDDYDGAAWTQGSHGSTAGIANGFPLDGVAASPQYSAVLTARIDLSGALSGTVPVFANPLAIHGLPSTVSWSSQDRLLLGAGVGSGVSTHADYVEEYLQPDPSIAQLRAQGPSVPAQLRSQLALPASLPAYVRRLTARLVRNASGPYERARAITDYFLDPSNGFSYDTQTAPGDSSSALVNFLRNKVGYCQQYAAATAVMMREAGVPARVVLGYMHGPVGKDGSFTVSTSDAHAWVEAYFADIGWVPFDPTPASGLADGAGSALPWARPESGSSGVSSASTQPTRSEHSPGSTASSSPTSTTPSTGRRRTQPVAVTSSPTSPSGGLWWAVGVLVVLALASVPALTRVTRRRRRIAAARHDGRAGPLWDELSATARDLGLDWSSARSPRQVAQWLAPFLGGGGGGGAGSRPHGRATTGAGAATSAPPAVAALAELAAAVEADRYAPRTADGGRDQRPTAADLGVVIRRLRAGRSRRTRLRAVFWPASLGWGELPSLRGEHAL